MLPNNPGRYWANILSDTLSSDQSVDQAPIDEIYRWLILKCVAVTSLEDKAPG